MTDLQLAIIGIGQTAVIAAGLALVLYGVWCAVEVVMRGRARR